MIYIGYCHLSSSQFSLEAYCDVEFVSILFLLIQSSHVYPLLADNTNLFMMCASEEVFEFD